MRRWTARTTALLPAAFALFLAGRLGAAEPVRAFQAPAKSLRLGRTVRFPGLVVQVLKLLPDEQAHVVAHTGLAGAPLTVLPLPPPAGELHVRVSNRSEVLLEIPIGETLVSPQGPSRSTERDVWIPAKSAAFVPVVSVGDASPTGPFVVRGPGLSPFEIERLRSGQWGARVRSRNQRFAVEPERLDDASAVYSTDSFRALASPYRAALAEAAADADVVVGVVLADHRGPFFARIETDAARFRRSWDALAQEIALDALVNEQTGVRAAPDTDGQMHVEVRRLLRPLVETEPLSRETFGVGLEHRWEHEDHRGTWTGSSVDGTPLSLTMLRDDLPRTTVPTPPPPGEPRDVGIAELERRPRPSAGEERQRDRREGLSGGVGAR